MKKIIHVITATAFVLGSAVACTNSDDDILVTEYDVCTVEAQQVKGDECGYWQHPDGSDVAVADHQYASDWAWIWFPWVVLGKTSHAPVAWLPPIGVEPPTHVVSTPKSVACVPIRPSKPRPADC